MREKENEFEKRTAQLKVIMDAIREVDMCDIYVIKTNKNGRIVQIALELDD